MSDDPPLCDFPPEQFTIRLFCDACDHQADLNRASVSETLLIPELIRRLRCAECGGREDSVTRDRAR